MDGGARVLALQSHTVHGYVGNKSAAFPLQLHGLEVDPLNSVQFSNHTGYGKVRGSVLHGDELLTLVEGLDENGLLETYSHILTGYIGSASFLRNVVEVVQRTRQRRKEARSGAGRRKRRDCRDDDGTAAVDTADHEEDDDEGDNEDDAEDDDDDVVSYFCDPVLGDQGVLYVPEELIHVYRTEVLPIASVITPNQFEVQWLTGIALHGDADALRACNVLHGMGPDIVFVTSVFRTDGTTPSTAVPDPDTDADTEEDDDEDGGAGEGARAGGGGGEDTDDLTNPAFFSMIATRNLRRSAQSNAIIWGPILPIRVSARKVDGQFTGTGDLCAALLLSWTYRTRGDLAATLENAAGTMHAVIERTAEFQQTAIAAREKQERLVAPPPSPVPSGSDDGASQRQHLDHAFRKRVAELRLIQSKADIEHPTVVHRATAVFGASERPFRSVVVDAPVVTPAEQADVFHELREVRALQVHVYDHSSHSDNVDGDKDSLQAFCLEEGHAPSQALLVSANVSLLRAGFEAGFYTCLLTQDATWKPRMLEDATCDAGQFAYSAVSDMAALPHVLDVVQNAASRA